MTLHITFQNKSFLVISICILNKYHFAARMATVHIETDLGRASDGQFH